MRYVKLVLIARREIFEVMFFWQTSHFCLAKIPVSNNFCLPLRKMVVVVQW